MAAMLKNYAADSRAPRYSILFALPLLVLYEALSALLTHSAVLGVRNGADVLLKSLFITLGGRYGLTLFSIALLGTGAYLVWRDKRKNREPLRAGYFAAMFGESLLYAALFGFVVGSLTSWLLSAPHMLAVLAPQGGGGGGGGGAGGVASIGESSRLVISLGAGIYEELVFRVLLVGLLLWLLRIVLGMGKGGSAVVAVVLSALIFSAFHYIGPYGDRLTLASFTFRAIAGLMFSALYVTRGLGITAWTHAMYDVMLTVVQS